MKDILYSDVIKDFLIDNNELFRRNIRSNKWKKITIKPNQNDGYCQVNWKGTMYQCHRIMYVLFTKTDLKGDTIMDHKNGNRIDNRIENLRVCTLSQNAMNRRPMKTITGIKGVSKEKGLYVARIRINGKRKYIGSYCEIRDAEEAYKRESLRVHGEFSIYSS